MYNSTTPECFVFNDKGSNDLTTAALLSGGGFGGGMNNPFWAIILLGLLRNGDFFGGNGGNGSRCQLSQIQEQLQTMQGQNSLLNAVTGVAGGVKDLATTINCDFNSVQAAINAIQAAICNVGNQVGMSSAQVINAIQSGNMSLANTLQSCCCDVKQLVTTQGYENRINNIEQTNTITKGFGDIAYATQAQTTALAANADANTRSVLAKLDQIEDSRKDREIASLTAQLTAANSRAERAAELAPITKALADIQCKQPSVVTLPYNCATAVPTSLLYGAGLYGYPYANGGNFG